MLSGKRCEYVECPGVENGVRMFKMKDVKELGGSFRFGTAVFKVQYKDQRKRCFHCDSVEHEAKDCTEKPVCSACGEEGHIHRKCHKSYSNRCQLTSSDWLVFDGGDSPFKEIMSRDQSEEANVSAMSGDSVITKICFLNLHCPSLRPRISLSGQVRGLTLWLVYMLWNCHFQPETAVVGWFQLSVQFLESM